jgi:hypothetical protein
VPLCLFLKFVSPVDKLAVNKFSMPPSSNALKVDRRIGRWLGRNPAAKRVFEEDYDYDYDCEQILTNFRLGSSGISVYFFTGLQWTTSCCRLLPRPLGERVGVRGFRRSGVKRRGFAPLSRPSHWKPLTLALSLKGRGNRTSPSQFLPMKNPPTNPVAPSRRFRLYVGIYH